MSAFFAGMLVSSLIYSAVSLAIPSFPQIIRWIILLLCAAMAAYIVWHSVKKGWPAALCTAVPIGYLIASGWRVYATGSIFDMAAIVMAAALYVIILRSKSQKLRVIPLAALTVFVILRFDLVLWLFKGL